MSKLVAAIMNKYGLSKDALRADGRLTLLADRAYRVHLIPASNGRLAIESKIRSLPGTARDAEDCIAHAMQIAVARMRESACGVAVDRNRKNLQLQCQIKADAALQDVERALEGFLKELTLWRELV